jgi:predicted DNA-binding WGR domain protein
LTPSDAELGRIGMNGQKAEVLDTIEATGQALEAVASAKRWRGYRDLQLSAASAKAQNKPCR